MPTMLTLPQPDEQCTCVIGENLDIAVTSSAAHVIERGAIVIPQYERKIKALYLQLRAEFLQQ